MQVLLNAHGGLKSTGRKLFCSVDKVSQKCLITRPILHLYLLDMHPRRCRSSSL